MPVNRYIPPIVFELLDKIRSLIPAGPKKKKKAIKVTKTRTVFKQPILQFGLKQGALVLGALAFAILGQMEWIQTNNPKSIGYGCVLYLIAVLLFLAAMRPWKYESLSRVPLSPRVEIVLFGIIMLIAAFFRIYKLDSIPNGIFMDQGFEGYNALRIAHEGWHPNPVVPDETMMVPQYPYYLMAPWFWIFKPTQFNLYLCFAVLALAAFPLIYWTFRQLAGPRVALLTTFLLAVMRWHVNFSRNAFPTIQVPFYMFGTLAFLLYGHRTRKLWAYCVSAVFLGLGLYTYQAFKIFPALVLIYAVYEFCADRKKFLKNIQLVIVFTGLFLLLASPIFYQMVKAGSVGTREAGNSIMSDVRSQHSWKPVYNMVAKTLLMCNRMGDDNERHNLPNRRMLDDISGVLFILGVFYALFRIKRRKYFYAISGLLIMSLPCLLSVVPAHANRMMGVTAFVCFLIAVPLTALWGRVRQRWGFTGEVIFLLVMAEPLLLIAFQNYNFYFNVQPNDNCYWTSSYWGAYSYDASVIGKEIAKSGDAYTYYLFPRHYEHKTIKYLTYEQRDNVKELTMPANIAPLQTDPKRGLFFAVLAEQKGFLGLLQSVYPHCAVETVKSPSGQVLLYMIKVSAEEAAHAKGLQAQSRNDEAVYFPDFPKGLPPGPYQSHLTGSVYIDKTDQYRFHLDSNAKVTWDLGGHQVLPGKSLKLLKGFYRVHFNLSAPSGPVSLSIVGSTASARMLPFDNTHFTSLDLGHGLRASYFDGNNFETIPVLEEWDLLVDFFNGTDFPFLNWKESGRWKGEIIAPVAGNYQFTAKTDEFAKIMVDGKNVVQWATGPRPGSIFLNAGAHSFQLDFQKVLGPSLTLSWIPPGKREFEVIPNSAFGTSR